MSVAAAMRIDVSAFEDRESATRGFDKLGVVVPWPIASLEKGNERGLFPPIDHTNVCSIT